MRKIAWTCVLVVLGLALAAQAVTLYDTDGYVYRVTRALGVSDGYQQYELRVSFDGGALKGRLFYAPQWRSVIINVFDNNDWYGWTLMGIWDGNGSWFAGGCPVEGPFSTQMYLNTRP